jgi:PHD-finger
MDESTIEVAVEGPPSPLASTAAVKDESPAQSHAHSAIPNLDGASEASTPSTGPRRGSFTSDIPPGHAVPGPIVDTPPNHDQATRLTPIPAPMITKEDLSTALSTSLAPKSGTLASQQLPHPIQQDELLTDSDPDFRKSAPPVQPASHPSDTSLANQSYILQLPQGYYSTYKLDETPQMPPPRREPKTSARRVKQYTLSDGTVVSGKGLGRGRPGVKRGPRNPKYSIVDPSGLLGSPGTGAGGSKSPTAQLTSSKKRKRTNSDASNIRTNMSASTSVTSGSRDSSVEYNPIQETRFGRKTQKPALVAPQASGLASPASKPPRLDSINSATALSPSVLKHHPKIKRRIYRGREQLALCEHCLRGHGPPGNVIVFCDACNKCWHQRCHDPQVPQSVIADTKAEWYCSDCDRILHGKQGKKAAFAKANATTTNESPVPAFAGSLIGGSALTHVQKQSYLNSLSKDKLISLVLSASELAPGLPLFQAPAPQLPQPRFTSNYTTPVSSTVNYHTAAAAAEEDEGYDSHFDEHAYLYPKPGNGIKLPPESTDLHMLLESKDSKTFSHWVRGMPGGDFSGSGDVLRNGQSHAHG